MAGPLTLRLPRIEPVLRLCQKQRGLSREIAVSQNQRLLLGGVIGLVIIAAIVYFAFFSGSNTSTSLASNGPSAGMSFTPTDMALGSPKAPVKVIEYGAPSCPVCAHFEIDNFDPLKKTFIDTGKVYFVFRVFPINGAADGAAEGLARCAANGSADKYFQFIDLLFRNQKDWDPEYSPPDGVHAGLMKQARIAGIDARADACMGDRANAERVNNVAQEAVQRYNINGTPTLVINGIVQQAGYMPWPQLKSLLDSFVAKAHA